MKGFIFVAFFRDDKLFFLDELREFLSHGFTLNCRSRKELPALLPAKLKVLLVRQWSWH